MPDKKEEAPARSSRLGSVLQQLCRVLLHATNPKDIFELEKEASNCRRRERTGANKPAKSTRRRCERKNENGQEVQSCVKVDESCYSQNMVEVRPRFCAVDNILHFLRHQLPRSRSDSVATKPDFSSSPRPTFRQRCNGTKTNNITDARMRKNSFVHWFFIVAVFITLHGPMSLAFPTFPSSEETLPSLPSAARDEWRTLTRHVRAPRGGTRSPRSRHERGIPGFLSKHSSPQRLYSRNYYFLEITRNGKVRGTTNRNSQYSLMRLESLSAGVLAIYGTKSGRYLAMNRKGNLYGSKRFNEECKFLEKMANRGYFYYEAAPVPRRGGRRRGKPPKSRYVGFDKNGKVKRGHRIKNSSKGALFLKYVKTKKRG